MSRSTRLSTAAHILIYLEQVGQARVRIDDIAENAGVHPSRLRQICSLLVQGGILKSYKGARGGIRAILPPSEVSLYDLSNCLGDLQFFALSPHEPNPDSFIGAAVNQTVSEVYDRYNDKVAESMKHTTIAELMELAGLKTPAEVS